MLVKHYLMLMVLAVVMWSTSGAVISKSARSISSAHGRSVVKRFARPAKYRKPRRRPPPTTPPPTPPTTPANGSCFYDGNYYQDGEFIEKSPCTFTQCLSGEVAIGDTFCEIDHCNENWEPNDCCPPCPTPSTAVPGCYENNRFYKYGEYITNEPCYSSLCTETGILYGDTFCDTPESNCNRSLPPNECCPTCPDDTTPTFTDTTTTPEIVYK